tara:strand:- start:860 stop:1366 length:507 start_codon:yes stop_codon:yes gene_type:complete
MDTSKQIVVDLETLSIHSNACIVSIGAVLIEDMEITDTFYINVDGRTCKEAGLHIDPDTIKWWGEQSKEAQEAWQKNPVPLQEAIDKFTLWYGKESIPIWGYGANFDVVILESAYRALNMNIPWKFWDISCLRTLMNVLDKRLPKANNHNALDDATAEAKVLIEILKS